MNLGVLVAIDGPAGSGKSTVAKRVAQELGVRYLDTGAMYRALTWLSLEEGIPLEDEDAVRQVADRLEFAITGTTQEPRFFVQLQEVTGAIREPRIADSVAVVARNLAVRAWMQGAQRALMHAARADGTGMVAEGRDITTVVCPDADVRVLLLADEETRLQRRTLELYGEDTPEFRAATSKQIAERDRSDSTVSEFLEPSPGVQVIDSSHYNVDQVVAQVIALVEETVN